MVIFVVFLYVCTMNILQSIAQSLHPLYDKGEAHAVARTLLEDGFGLTQTDILMGKDSKLSAQEREELEKSVHRLLQGEPVQYVTGRAWFMGRSFSVRPGCLIPRPETEDLVEAIVQDYEALKSEDSLPDTPLRVLDIGTGSGCIAISLSLALGRQARVEAWDVSEEALRIASENAQRLEADVTFCWQDVLSPSLSQEQWDIIVSNPPYIPPGEMAEMERNVLDFEPHMALFVPENDPLLFYRHIATYALRTLKPGGQLWFETNRYKTNHVIEMLDEMGFFCIKKANDRFGHPRHLQAQKP